MDDEQLWAVGAEQPVAHAHPQHRLGLGDVVSPQRQRVAVQDVVVGAGLAVGAEGLLQRLARRGRAEPGVAVEVVGADPGTRDRRQRPVLLQEQLARGVEGDRRRTVLVKQRTAPTGDVLHRLVPSAGSPLDQRRGEPVWRRVGLPGEQVLGPEAAAIDAVLDPPAHADDPAVANRDVHRVAVGVQQRRRGHPALHGLRSDAWLEMNVDAGRPCSAAGDGRRRTLRILDAVMHGQSCTRARLAASGHAPRYVGRCGPKSSADGTAEHLPASAPVTAPSGSAGSTRARGFTAGQALSGAACPRRWCAAGRRAATLARVEKGGASPDSEPR
jgi:hypothetical protein